MGALQQAQLNERQDTQTDIDQNDPYVPLYLESHLEIVIRKYQKQHNK